LIDTIRSRTTYVSFNKATQDEIVRSLKRVVRGEKIKIDKKALQMIADASDGSFRDAVKILEQLVSEKGKKKLNKESVEEFIAGKSFSSVEKILDHLLGKSAKDALVELDSFVKQGGEVKILIERLIYKLREALLSEVGMGEGGIEGLEKAEIVKLIRLFSRAASELPTAVLDQIPVELAIIEWCEQDDLSKRGNGSGKKSAKSTDRGGTKSSNDIGSTGSASSNGESKSNGESTKPIGDVEIGKDVWNEILSLVKPVNFSTEALLRAARPVNYDGKTLTIGVYYEFHKERLDQLQHRKILEEVVMRVVGTPVRVNCKLVAPERKKVEEKSKEEVVLTESGETSGEGDDILEAAKEIFGS
jgi:DNA polymerase-3 subunit gamma/tau